MKIYSNKKFRQVLPNQVESFEDLSIFLDNISKSYIDLLTLHFHAQEKREKREWKESFMSIDKMAKLINKNEKTVDRFNRDMQALVQKKRRFFAGKQTSNAYVMTNNTFSWLKAFAKLGLFSKNKDFKTVWSWIKKLWVQCNCDKMQFMNRVWGYRSWEKNNSSEQAKMKMSLGESDKCPSIFIPISILEECTDKVPPQEVKKIETYLQRKVAQTLQDINWYAKQNTINSWSGLFRERLKASVNF